MSNIELQGIPSEELTGKPTARRITDKNLVSSVVRRQFPGYVQEGYDKFLLFIEAYYEWLEYTGNTDYHMRRLEEYQDVDTTIDEFFESFKKEFLVNLPQNIQADRALLLKNIKDYYLSRGNEKSYEFFFRMLYGIDSVEFYYPRTDILRASDGNWQQHTTLKVFQKTGDVFALKGNTIRGTNNNGSAFIEKIHKVQLGEFTAYELFLNVSSIRGSFIADEIIYNEDLGITAQTFPVVNGVNIIESGIDYEVGDSLIFTATFGLGAEGKVSSVSDTGEILKVEMTNFGIGYYDTVSVDVQSVDGNSAVIEAVIGAIGKYPGDWIDTDGHLNSNKYLQDGYYYQQFSYVTIVEESLHTYQEQLKKQLHPAGLLHFGQFRSQTEVDASSSIPDGNANTHVRRILDRHLEDAGSELEETKTILINNSVVSESSKKLGPTLSSIERDKFKYLPHEDYVPKKRELLVGTVDGVNTDFTIENGIPKLNTESIYHYDSGVYSLLTPVVDYTITDNDVSLSVAPISGTLIVVYQPEVETAMENYWDEYANYQIKDFADFTFNDFIETPRRSTNIVPEAELIVSKI
jgi:hypothetical protein